MKYIFILFFQAFSVFGRFIAPLVCFVWLVLAGGWLQIGYIFVLYVLVCMVALQLLKYPGYMYTTLCCSALLQFAFHHSVMAWVGGAEYSRQLMLASLALASIPPYYLGKGFETNPGVVAYKAGLEIAGCVAAWMLFHGEVTSIFSVFGIYAIGSAVGFLLIFISTKLFPDQLEVVL
jgi:hypothetical protein